MPRPRKCRKVCCLPKFTHFAPVGAAETEQEAIVLTIDEYEAIRLIDKEGFSQEECGEYMQIARTTAQQIYTSARKKIADALVDGLPLHIRGGDYSLCSGEEAACRCGGCPKHRLINEIMEHKTGEARTMKILVPVDEDKKSVCVSLGRAPYFLVYDQETKASECLENPAAQAEGGAGIKAAQFIVDQNAAVLLTVRCGENAAEVFRAAEIEIYKTQGTDALEEVHAYEENKLEKLTHFHAGYHGIQ